ncbi:GNAT family N-acetyltransferase [[Clostridium] innocuum]|nr:GNAT family N-acetyltransferase [[Clostridium] innocuum]
MITRKAVLQDLTQLKSMYKKIIAHMNAKRIEIWDDCYPCAFFQEDITAQRLYVLEEKGTLMAAFALCEDSAGADHVTWGKSTRQVRYLERLGVNPDYMRSGIGSTALHEAIRLSKEAQAEALRLFVVDINHPAIRLYEKNGFQKAAGIYDEVIDDDLTFHEFGFEFIIADDKHIQGDALHEEEKS